MAVGLLASLSCAGLLLWWSFLPQSTVSSQGQRAFEVLPGESKFEVTDRLTSDGLLNQPLLMKLYWSSLVWGAPLIPRPHLLEPGLSPRQLVARLSELDDRDRVQVTLVEGWTAFQIAEKLEKEGVCSRLGFEAAAYDRKLLDELAIFAPSAEGYLFPATYPLFLDADPTQVVARLVHEAKKRIARLPGERHPDLQRLHFSEHDMVTLASIVEKETGRSGERPRVARVFLNRLLHPEAGTRGRLQSDPTAVYGCLVDPLSAPSCAALERGSPPTPEMLRDGQNPYNTYRHSGLPPGPISNPGELALLAVLHPAEGNELYFVSDGQGGHLFTEDFEQHKKAVERLREKRVSAP